jgi:hypothetical protein
METPQLDINKIVADLRTHSVHMNLLTVLVMVVALAVVGVVYVHSSNSFERQMARADTVNAQYHKDLSDLEIQLKSDQQMIGQLEAQKAQVTTQIVYRDKTTDAKIVVVAAPSRSEAQVSDDVQVAYKFPPVKVDSGLFSFTLPETQTFVVTEIDRDRLALNLQDSQKQVSLGTQETVTLTADVQATKKELVSAQGVIDAYKKVAKKSKFKSFLGNVAKAALFIGGVYIGRRI